MSDLSDPNRLIVVLNMLSANDTNTVKKGEKLLKPFLKNPTCILPLLNQIRGSQDVSIRHHCSLLLKKKLGGFYPKFNAQQQNELKEQLLIIMVAEPTKAVATALAGAVALVAKAIFAKNGTWPELFNVLMRLAAEPNQALRILNFSLLAQLAEHVAIHLKPHTQTLAQMFVSGCQDPVSAVAVAALSATAAYIMELGNEEEIMHLKVVINPMLQVMHNCLQSGDDETVTEGLDVIQECCNLEQPLVNDHIEVIVQFVIAIIQNKEYETSIKQSAGQTLMNIVECRPKLVAKKGLVGPTLAVLMEMIAKEDSSAAGSLFSFQAPEGILDEDKDEDDSPEMDVQKLAQTIIDVMAMHIPSKYFVDPALTLCAQGMMSPDPNMRKAGCAVLGVISEGCSDRIRENLSEILPRLLAAVQDPEFYVRECACFALGQFSEHCQPDILHYNQMVLPVIFQALDDQRPTVQSTSCYVLEYFCEGLQRETLRPYLVPLMTRLAHLLSSESKVTKEMALTAIAATAVAAEIDFLPFSETICNILGAMLFNTDAANFSLRGRALECLGHIAVAVEEEHFGRYFQDGMRSAIQGLQLNDESLKEHCFVFIANCAKVMSKSFDPYLPELVPYLLEVVAESELSLFEQEGDNDDEEDEEAGENDSLGDNVRLNVEEGFINAKKAALTALGALAEHTKHSFYPYLERTINVLLAEAVGAIYSLHDLVRAEALNILQFCLKSACEGNGLVNLPKTGEILALPDAVSSIAKVVMEIYIHALIEDNEKLPVSNATEGLFGVLRLLGLAALQLRGAENNLLAEEMMKAIDLLLKEKAPCQLAAKHEGGDDEDDDHDNLVIDAVTDLIGELAKILKHNFVGYFDEFQKHLLRFTKPARTHSDRSMAIGCYAEVVAEIGPAAVKYADFLLPVIKVGLTDQMEGVRRNSAFCVGVLVESTGSALQSQFLNILQWLHPLCIRSDAKKTTDVGGADVDNALSAVARIIRVAHTMIPLNQVLPVILAALPLREDTSEGPNVYGCIANLVLTNDPTAVAMIQNILQVFGNTLTKDSHDEDETKGIVVSTMRQMLTIPNHQAALQTYLAQINDAELRLTLQQQVVNPV